MLLKIGIFGFVLLRMRNGAFILQRLGFGEEEGNTPILFLFV